MFAGRDLFYAPTNHADNSGTLAKGTRATLPPEITYRMPAEWEPHEATWLGWPHELTDWPGKFAPIPWAFAEIVRHLARVEQVFLLVENRDAESRVKAILRKSGANLDAVTFFRVPSDRGWMRDSGPISVSSEDAVILRSEATKNLSSNARIAETAKQRSILRDGEATIQGPSG